MNNSNNIELIIPKGCDNAPRKQIIIDFTVAILMQQDEVIEKYAADSIVWDQLKENKKIEGRCSFISVLYDENINIIESIEIYQVITHGKFASINGVISLTDGERIDFCDVYTFSSAAKSGKVKKIKSYRL